MAALADGAGSTAEELEQRHGGQFQDLEDYAPMGSSRRRPVRAMGYPFRLLARAARLVVPRRRRGRRGVPPPFSSLSLAMPDPFEDGVGASLDDGPSTSGNAQSLELETYGYAKRSSARTAQFPVVLRQQVLLTIGSRHWGNWMTGACGISVPIYDFAIHVDRSQVQRQPQELQEAASSLVGGQGLQLRGDVYQQLREAAPDADISLTIRAARNLPIKLLSEEFDRILRRRTLKVGGDPSDPALEEVLRYFSSTRLPRQVLAAGGEAVRKGSTITFTRSAGGRLATWAEDVPLGTVTSPGVCDALFDLYLGDQPVCKKAKLAAAATLARMVVDVRHAYQPSGGEQMLCAGGGDDETACYVKLR